jgi:hypothetical protein
VRKHTAPQAVSTSSPRRVSLDGRSVAGLVVLGALTVLFLAAGAAGAASNQATGPSGTSGTSGTTPTWDVSIHPDPSKPPLIVFGKATYTDAKGVVHAATRVVLTLNGADGVSLASKSACGYADPLFTTQPAGPADAGTLDIDGNYSFSIELQCAQKGMTAKVDASLPPTAVAVPPTGTQTSGPFDYDPNATPPTTTTTTTTTSKVPPFQPKILPAPPATAGPVPTLPHISGSRTQAVSPGDDTYNPTLNYPEPGDENPVLPDASGLAKSRVTAKPSRTLNTRLLAASAAGVALTGVMVSQILVLNRRGRELEASLPLLDDHIAAG